MCVQIDYTYLYMYHTYDSCFFQDLPKPELLCDGDDKTVTVEKFDEEMMKYSVKEHPYSGRFIPWLSTSVAMSDKLKMENLRGTAPARQQETASTCQAFDDSIAKVRLLTQTAAFGI